MTDTPQLMRELASARGLELAYDDWEGRRVEASTDALAAVLAAMGITPTSSRQVEEEIRQAHRDRWRLGLSPVTVAWTGAPAAVGVNIDPSRQGARARLVITLEDGSERSLDVSLADCPVEERTEVDGGPRARVGVPLPADLAEGRHRLLLELGSARAESRLIVAPERAPEFGEARRWSAFLPLHALRSETSWGVGDHGDLARLMDWVSGLGGDGVAVLPLHPCFLDGAVETSPYAPVSRLLWNELHVDVTAVPELESCPEARGIAESAELQAELAALRSAPLVDHRRVMMAKRCVLEALVRERSCWPEGRRAAFREFAEANRVAADHARFRAVREAHRFRPWRSWPERLRAGRLQGGDHDPFIAQYHLYAQWLASEQVERLASRSDGGLFLDLPLGVHPDGHDAWRQKRLFVRGVSVGAPPDALFSRGQDWGFSPIRPNALEDERHEYSSACLRHQLRHARMVRVDHVMGLHRQFWIPEGFSAAEGVYVRQQADELHALVTLEARRAGCPVAGENLGTVPPEVEQRLQRHALAPLHVLQFGVDTGEKRGLVPVAAGSVASLGTHDTPTLAGWLEARDVTTWNELGFLDDERASSWRERRGEERRVLADVLREAGALPAGDDPPAAELMRAALLWLAGSDATCVQVSLEDLWLETEPQNVPGTTTQRPNWRRKAKLSLEEMTADEALSALLREVDAARRRVSP